MPAPPSDETEHPQHLGAFREVFRRHPAGVAVLTASYNGTPFGFTATSVASLSADPPRFTFNMARTSSSWPAIANTNYVGVHMLTRENQALADRFARTKDRFSGEHWSPGPHGVPLLHDVAGWLVGRISLRLSFENNAVVVAEVVDGGVGQQSAGAALLYHGGAYGTPASTDYVI